MLLVTGSSKIQPEVTQTAGWEPVTLTQYPATSYCSRHGYKSYEWAFFDPQFALSKAEKHSIFYIYLLIYCHECCLYFIKCFFLKYKVLIFKNNLMVRTKIERNHKKDLSLERPLTCKSESICELFLTYTAEKIRVCWPHQNHTHKASALETHFQSTPTSEQGLSTLQWENHGLTKTS